jgi:hypothetical protein
MMSKPELTASPRLLRQRASRLQLRQQQLDSIVALEHFELIVDRFGHEGGGYADGLCLGDSAAHPFDRRRVLIRGDGEMCLGSLGDRAGTAMLRDEQIAAMARLGEFRIELAQRRP